jgi:hypothetical protein
LGNSLQGEITVHTLVLRGRNRITAKFLCLLRIHAQDFGKSEQSCIQQSATTCWPAFSRVRTV